MMASSPLFRREAVEFQRDQRQWGEVVLLQPLSTKVAAWGAVASVSVMIMFLFVAPYARKETVAGFLLPTAGIARVHVPRPGIISGVHVREGQEVEEGQPLLSIASDQVAGDGTDVNAAILASLAQQRDLLWRQIEAEDQWTASERARASAP
jgi:membrane fusion protein